MYCQFEEFILGLPISRFHSMDIPIQESLIHDTSSLKICLFHGILNLSRILTGAEVAGSEVMRAPGIARRPAPRGDRPAPRGGRPVPWGGQLAETGSRPAKRAGGRGETDSSGMAGSWCGGQVAGKMGKAGRQVRRAAGDRLRNTVCTAWLCVEI